MNEDNPFKKIEEHHPPAPRELKERVMTSVKLSQLLIEVTDLFTDKMGKTALDLFRTDIYASNDSTNDPPTPH